MRVVAASNRPYHRLTAVRTFVNAKVKWVRDPFLDSAVEREKDLRAALSLRRRILSSHSLSLPLASLPKPQHLPNKFFLKYPSLFTIYQPGPGLPPRVRLTRRAVSLPAGDDAADELSLRRDSADRLARVLMLAGARRAPISLIQSLAWDLGLDEDFAPSLIADFPDYFTVCEIEASGELGVEIVQSTRTESLAAKSELQRRRSESGGEMRWIEFPMSFPRGFDLPKKVDDWVRHWQALPYISPYENGFHLAPSSDEAEKWAVAVLHELIWQTVSKKAEREAVVRFGEWLGFERPALKKAIVHHPGIFYVSNKLSTQTVVLREAYRKDLLLHKHAAMSMRFRYISLMNSATRRALKTAL